MKIKSTIMIILLSLLIGNGLFAQPTLQWQKNFGSGGNDKAYSVKSTRDGGFIVAGQSDSNDVNVSGNHGKADFLVIKLDKDGNITWQKSIGGSNDDIPTSIQQTLEGGYIVAGGSRSIDGDVTNHGVNYHIGQGGVTYPDYATIALESWIVKLDSNGEITWNLCLHHSEIRHDFNRYFDNITKRIIQLEDSSYVYGGLTEESIFFPAGNTNVMMGKISKNGVAIGDFSQFPGQSLYYEINSLAAIKDGFVTTGNFYDYSSGESNDQVFVTTLDKDLNVIAIYQYGGTKADFAYDVVPLKNGGFVVAGSSASIDGDLLNGGNHGGDDFWLLKIKNTGEVVWSKSYGGSGQDVAKSVQELSDGSLVAAGSSFSADGQVTGHSANTIANADYWLIKTDSSGNLQWNKSFGGTGNDEANSVHARPAGFIVAGSAASTDAGFVNRGNSDYWLLNFNFSICGIVPLPVSCNQLFCSASNPVIADLKATGVNLKWYNLPVGGNPLNTASRLISCTYYVTQTISANCESERKAVTVTVSPSPAIPDARLFQVFCKNKLPKVSDLVATGTRLKWYRDATCGSPLSTSKLLVTGLYYVSQTTADGCESKRRTVFVIVCACRNSHNRYRGQSDEMDSKIISVYPNPASGIAHVKINIDDVDKVIIQVIDVNGKIWLQQTLANSKTNFQKTIDVSKFPVGFYALKYITTEETGVVKFQVIK